MEEESHSPKKVKLVALGCRTNQYELQAYRDQLTAGGSRCVEGNEEADLCIVNTCTVTEAAERDSRYQVRQLAKYHPGARIIVTGCAAERNPAAFREIAGVTEVISNNEKEELLSIIYPEEEWPEFAIRQFEAHTRAFIKVQDGCNSYCSYCIIPYVRGRSRSRTIAEIVREAEGLVANGYLEIVLTGINIGDFEDDSSGEAKRLVDLVNATDVIPGLKRLRISSIDPDEVDDPLADAVLAGKTTCHSMHLVLQSGSNVVLKRMNRKYTRQIFLETAQKMRARSSDFTFTTDVIVGFPGETEEDHQETLAIIRAIRFAKVHMFPFSPRARTRAAILPNQVPADIVQRRKQEVLRLSEQVAFELREEFVGTEVEVLTESVEKGKSRGHTSNFLPVVIEGESLKSNQLVTVRLVENGADGLVGTIL